MNEFCASTGRNGNPTLAVALKGISVENLMAAVGGNTAKPIKPKKAAKTNADDSAGNGDKPRARKSRSEAGLKAETKPPIERLLKGSLGRRVAFGDVTYIAEIEPGFDHKRYRIVTAKGDLHLGAYLTEAALKKAVLSFPLDISDKIAAGMQAIYDHLRPLGLAAGLIEAPKPAERKTKHPMGDTVGQRIANATGIKPGAGDRRQPRADGETRVLHRNTVAPHLPEVPIRHRRQLPVGVKNLSTVSDGAKVIVAGRTYLVEVEGRSRRYTVSESPSNQYLGTFVFDQELLGEDPPVNNKMSNDLRDQKTAVWAELRAEMVKAGLAKPIQPTITDQGDAKNGVFKGVLGKYLLKLEFEEGPDEEVTVVIEMKLVAGRQQKVIRVLQTNSDADFQVGAWIDHARWRSRIIPEGLHPETRAIAGWLEEVFFM